MKLSDKCTSEALRAKGIYKVAFLHPGRYDTGSSSELSAQGLSQIGLAADRYKNRIGSHSSLYVTSSELGAIDTASRFSVAMDSANALSVPFIHLSVDANDAVTAIAEAVVGIEPPMQAQAPSHCAIYDQHPGLIVIRDDELVHDGGRRQRRRRLTWRYADAIVAPVYDLARATTSCSASKRSL